MQENVTGTECCGWLMQIHICVKEKSGYFKHKLCVTFTSSVTKYYSCWRMLNSWLLLIAVVELCCEIRLCSAWKSLFINVYKCDVIMTSSAAMNIWFLHRQNLPFLRYIHCNFCLNLLITHGDMFFFWTQCRFLNDVCYINSSFTDFASLLFSCHNGHWKTSDRIVHSKMQETTNNMI